MLSFGGGGWAKLNSLLCSTCSSLTSHAVGNLNVTGSSVYRVSAVLAVATQVVTNNERFVVAVVFDPDASSSLRRYLLWIPGT